MPQQTRVITKGQQSRFVKTLTPYMMILPAIILMGLIILVPIIRGIYMSFTTVNIMQRGAMTFVGLKNYEFLLQDPIFNIALRNTITWTLGVVFFQYIIGLGTALLLNEPIPLRGLFRGLVLVPWVVPSVVAALTWRWIYVPDYGILNYILRTLMIIDRPIQWLSNPDIAMSSVLVVGIWKWVPFMAVVLLSGLQSISNDLYEAAVVDGANIFQRFWFITMPHIRQLSTIVIMLSIIWTFNHFDIVYVMTRGGPASATHLLSTYAYLNAFNFNNFGYAAVLSVVMLVILLTFVIIFSRILLHKDS